MDESSHMHVNLPMHGFKCEFMVNILEHAL